MNMYGVLFDGRRQLRSGFRVLAFLMLWIFCASIISTIAFAVSRTVFPEGLGTFATLALDRGAALVAAVLIGLLCSRWFENLPGRALGISLIPGWFKNFVTGMILGAVGILLAVGVGIWLGQLRFTLNASAQPSDILVFLVVTLVTFGIAAAFEEVLFRGYMFQTLTRAGLSWVAILLTAVFFGSVHLGNPNATAISTVDTVIAGVLFGVAYLKSRDIWFPFGIHLMWNWMQGPVFGIEVSGLTEFRSGSLLREIDYGPAWVTGANYGIEGGIASTVALAVLVAAVYFLPLITPNAELIALNSNDTPKEFES